MRRSLLTALLALACCPAAGAQQGVTIDPDSPTAKEYALPLDSARRAASGDEQAPPAAPQTQGEQPAAELFGEGVGEDSESPRSGGGSPQPARSQATPEAPGAPVVRPAISTPGAPDDGGIGTTLLIIGGGAALVGAGAATGFALRRRRGA